MANEFIPFCNYQFVDKEESQGLNGCCKIFMLGGVAYCCPFSEEGIYSKQEGDKYLFKIKRNSGENCSSFNITENAKNSLTHKLK